MPGSFHVPAAAVNYLGRAYKEDATEVSTTATIPADNTIPQSGEGVEFTTLAYTPTKSTSRLRISFSGMFRTSARASATVALFKDADAGALAAVVSQLQTDDGGILSLVHEMVSGTTSAITFKIRIGRSASTLDFLYNRFSTAGKSTFVIEEFEA